MTITMAPPQGRAGLRAAAVIVTVLIAVAITWAVASTRSVAHPAATHPAAATVRNAQVGVPTQVRSAWTPTGARAELHRYGAAGNGAAGATTGAATAGTATHPDAATAMHFRYGRGGRN